MAVHPHKNIVKQLANLWNLRRLVFQESMYRTIPIVIFGSKKNVKDIGSIKWIESQNCPVKFFHSIMHVFSFPDLYINMDKTPQEPLSEDKKMLLEILMKGCNVKKISRLMDTHPKMIFYKRKQLLKKFGLQSRLDFTYLSYSSLLL